MLCLRAVRFFRQKRNFNKLVGAGTDYGHDEHNNSYYKYAYIGGAATVGLFGYKYLLRTGRLDHAQEEKSEKKKLENLPIYKQEEVKKHGKDADRIWVTYKDGVYDVTDFISMHPGGEKILLAAGTAVDPFWALYSQHKTPEVLEILEGYRIGRLDVKDVPKVRVSNRDGDFNGVFSLKTVTSV